MENIVKYVVECDSLYGMICVIFLFITTYAIIHFVVPYIYKAICKICNTIVKYNDVHAKAATKNTSFEVDLKQ